MALFVIVLVPLKEVLPSKRHDGSQIIKCFLLPVCSVVPPFDHIDITMDFNLFLRLNLSSWDS